jgi:hypothetical protein
MSFHIYTFRKRFNDKCWKDCALSHESNDSLLFTTSLIKGNHFKPYYSSQTNRVLFTISKVIKLEWSACSRFIIANRRTIFNVYLLIIPLFYLLNIRRMRNNEEENRIGNIFNVFQMDYFQWGGKQKGYFQSQKFHYFHMDLQFRSWCFEDNKSGISLFCYSSSLKKSAVNKFWPF